jgi:hypothetical protein
MINEKCSKFKDLNNEQVYAINLLHDAREIMFTAAETTIDNAKAIYPAWLALEAALQRLWGFDEDATYIKIWNYPHCSCPKIDNDDTYPFGYYTFNNDCPIHGKIYEQTN